MSRPENGTAPPLDAPAGPRLGKGLLDGTDIARVQTLEDRLADEVLPGVMQHQHERLGHRLPAQAGRDARSTSISIQRMPAASA
ncbi:MAG: hypothetical protein EXR98_21380 [Gemmataceae bacterium]|nr:hypothetical protein [Gemmataceae bacterium]